jgi:hypothetical protein
MKPAMRLEIAKLQDMSVDQSKLGKLGGETWGHPQTLAAAVTRCCHRMTPRMLMSNELRACAGRNHGIGRQRAAVNSDGIQGQSSASKTAGSVR